MLCLSGEDDNEHEVILLIQVAVVADLVQTRLLNPSTLQLCDEKSVKRSHHVLSNHTMSENTFLWKTVMIYIMSFK